MLLALVLAAQVAAAAPLCPKAEVDKIREAVQGFDNEPALSLLQFTGPDGGLPPPPDPQPAAWTRFDFAATAVSGACTLPPGLERGLGEVAMVAPEMQHLMVFRALAEDPATLLAMCGTAGPGLLAQAGQATKADGVRLLVEGCKADGYGFATKEELLLAPLARVVSAMTLNRVLTAAQDPAARPLARLLLGLRPEA